MGHSINKIKNKKLEPQDCLISYHKIKPIYTAWFDFCFRQKKKNLVGLVERVAVYP
jgi:hypothetical protein